MARSANFNGRRFFHLEAEVATNHPRSPLDVPTSPNLLDESRIHHYKEHLKGPADGRNIQLSHSICHAKCLKQLKPIHSQCVQQPISSPHRIKVPRPTFAALAAIHLRHCRLRCKFWQLWHLQIFTQSSVSDKHSMIFIYYSYIIPCFSSCTFGMEPVRRRFSTNTSQPAHSCLYHFLKGI